MLFVAEVEMINKAQMRSVSCRKLVFQRHEEWLPTGNIMNLGLYQH